MFWIAFEAALGASATGCASAPPPALPRRPGPVAPAGRMAPFQSLDDLLLANDPDPRRSEIVLIALSQVGVPYVWGGAKPEAGFDCSGLMTYVFWQAMRVALPRTTWDQAKRLRTIEVPQLRPADLVFFNTLGREYSHVGLFIGNDRFVHAPATGHPVRVEPLALDYWRDRFNGARRVVS